MQYFVCTEHICCCLISECVWYLTVCVRVHWCCLHAQGGLRRVNNHVVHIFATRSCGVRLWALVVGGVLFGPGNQERIDFICLTNIRFSVSLTVTEVNLLREMRQGRGVWLWGNCGMRNSLQLLWQNILGDVILPWQACTHTWKISTKIAVSKNGNREKGHWSVLFVEIMNELVDIVTV